MKRLIIKGLLLWFTAIDTMLYILSLGNIIERGEFVLAIIIGIVIAYLIGICIKSISYKELHTLSLYKYFKCLNVSE